MVNKITKPNKIVRKILNDTVSRHMSKPTRVKVIVPRLFTNEKEGDIITMFNIDNEPDNFMLFGGVYQKLK